MTTLWQDILYGFRMLLKKPGFTIIAALSLGLGIGANATIFSIINATLLSDLPYPDASRLAVIWTAPLNRPGNRNNVTAANYLAWKDRSQSFQSMGALYSFPSNLGAERDGSPAERLDGAHFSYSMWDVLGVKPLKGRVFTKDEDQDGNPAPVIVLSYPFWQRRFAGDPNVLGRKVLIDNAETTIIGVMPKGFDYASSTTDFWGPLGFTPQQLTSVASFLLVGGRLKPGVSIQQAQAEMASIAQGLVGLLPGNNKDTGVLVEAMQGAFFRGLEQPLTVLQGAVAFVLLIACANVAGLLLARAASRRTEMAVRSSLGAGRGRIVRQLLTESILLAILGGMLGGVFAWVGLKGILASLPVGSLPDDLSISGRVLAFTALISILTGLVFGLIPALQTSKVDLSTSLKESARGGSEGLTKQRLRGALVTAQIGLALVLLIGAGLMMNSFLRIQQNELGGDPKGLLTFDFRFPQSQLMKPVGKQYRGVGLWDISPNVALTYDRLFERVRGLPGVISAAGASRPPFAGAMGMQFRILGRPAPEPGAQGQGGGMGTAYMPVTPNYFSTVRIPLLQGRDFAASDTASAPPVVIISKAMAQRWWPNESPLGQRIVFDFVPDEVPREIVGVVGDVRLNQTQTQPGPIVYLPHVQQSQRWLGPSWNYRSAMFYVLRTSGNPTSVSSAVRSAVAEIDPSKPVGNLQTVEQSLRDQVSGRRVYMLLLSVFGAIAAVLAAVGIYGVMAYAVTQRTREIGIRMALGATSTSVMTLVVKQALILVFIGLILGIGGAFGLTRFIANELYGVKPTDPATFIEVSLGLVVVAVLASLIPTRRAVSVDPTIALRHE